MDNNRYEFYSQAAGLVIVDFERCHVIRGEKGKKRSLITAFSHSEVRLDLLPDEPVAGKMDDAQLYIFYGEHTTTFIVRHFDKAHALFC